MIKFDEDEGTFSLVNGTTEEIAELDAKLARVAPEELRWLAPGVEAPRVRGLGDAVKWLADAIGVRTCGGCEKRREWLNEKIPFGPKKEPDAKD